MIKLLIVDDEPLVQIGIKSMLKWEELGIEICGAAMNGEAALGLIREYRPELVITDIRMPIMNGLELAKACREEFGSLPLFLFLTSYEEFQLVRQALSYQAVDYLIKLELDADTLRASIQRALERLEQLRPSQPPVQEAGRPLLQSYSEKFYIRLLHNLFDSREQFQIQAEDLRLTFEDRCYIASHGEIHSSTAKEMDDAGQMKLYSSTLQMMREILSKYMKCHVISLDKIHFAVICRFPSMDGAQDETLRAAWDSACSMIHNYFSVQLTVGTGDAVDDPLKISVSYQEARQACNHAAQGGAVAFSQISQEAFRDAFNMALFKGPLTQAFEEFDTDVLHHTLTEIMELFSAHPQRHIQAMDGACSILYLALSLLPEGEETMQSIFAAWPEGYRSIYRSETTVEVVRWLAALRDGLCEALRSKRKTYKEHVISNAQKYINSHIEERLTLNEVAAVFGLSPNYLSSLFKKSCHVGFTEYVTQRKISRAKSLLLEQDRKIYEVADLLGFESAFYFSKVFKKVEGVSPREFLQSRLSAQTEEDAAPALPRP